MDPAFGDLVAKLANPEERSRAARELAQRAGATALRVFLRDTTLRARLTPVPGFEKPVPDAPGWNGLLERALAPGRHRGRVEWPAPPVDVEATALASDGIAIVLVEPHDRGADPFRQIEPYMPLLARTLTAEAELVRALDDARCEAASATKVKDDFLAMLGHELRNPLAPIVTALQLMRMKGIATREQDVIERQVGHLMRLVDDLLDVARITRGMIDLRSERFELLHSVNRAIEMSRPLLEQKRHELVVDVASAGLGIEGDPARIAQIIANLLTNAAKYSEHGKRIELNAMQVDGTVVITVADDGIGIEPDLLERIFMQFMQTPQGIDRTQGGLGLGLAIVRSLVTLHGGSVRALSEGPGHGSRFVVELPAADGDVPASLRNKTDPPKASPSKDGRRRVLVVDDNEDAAELLCTLLDSMGFVTRGVTSAFHALECIDDFDPAVAVLDLGLPVMDGFELARKIRDRAPEVRLIAVTGYGQECDRARTKATGFGVHLVKPVRFEQLRASIDDLLSRP